jgi:hypothetical protein
MPLLVHMLTVPASPADASSVGAFPAGSIS